MNRPATLAAQNTRIVLACVTLVASMLGLAYASVPLYRMFCQATGYGGTTQRSAAASATVLDREITVRFDANVEPGLAWTFKPEVSTLKVKLGATTVAHYHATNFSDHVITGTARFNVAPDIVGQYFNKLECFCFSEQRLEPGESADLAVSFFVDPALVDNRDARDLSQITLSYRFYPVDATMGAVAAAKPRAPKS